MNLRFASARETGRSWVMTLGGKTNYASSLLWSSCILDLMRFASAAARCWLLVAWIMMPRSPRQELTVWLGFVRFIGFVSVLALGEMYAYLYCLWNHESLSKDTITQVLFKCICRKRWHVTFVYATAERLGGGVGFMAGIRAGGPASVEGTKGASGE